MKITIKSEKRKLKKKITVDTIKPGTVFKFDGAVALKLKDSKTLLLTWSSDRDALVISDGSMNCYSIEILGRLDEIIVVKE